MNVPQTELQADRAERVALAIDVKENTYFPSQVFSCELPSIEHVNSELLDAIYAERKRDQKGIQRSNFRKLGGWHSRNDLHNEECFREVTDRIRDMSAEISAKNQYHKGYKLTIGTMWAIINPPGSSNRAHIHPGCVWSGVYYVQAPINAGDIEFTHPRTQNVMQQPRYMPNQKRPRNCWTKVNFAPVAGKMLIFPSWLYHSVAPNMAEGKGRDGDRVVISFNLNQSKI